MSWTSGHVVVPLALVLDTLLFHPLHGRLLHLSAAFSCWLSTLGGVAGLNIYTSDTEYI